jgi:hypothetical protein
MPAFSMPRASSARVDRVLIALGLACAAALLGVFLGRVAASHYGPGAIEAVIGIPLLVVIARRPGVALVVLLLVVCTVFDYSSLPRLNMPGHPPINIADLALLAAVGGTLWRRPWRAWPVAVRRYFAVLVLFLLLASVATIKTSLLGASQARDALFSYRNLLYLGIALTISIELTGARWRATLNVAIAFAGALSILSVVAAASPSVAHELQLLNPITIYSPGATNASGGVALGNTARVRLTGLFFIYSMLLPTLVMVLAVKDGWRRGRIVALLLMLAAVALSLNRNMYAGAAVGLLVTGVLGGSLVRARIAMLITAVVLASVLVVSSSISPAVTAEVGRRAGTIVSPSQVLQSNSAKDRSYELSFALPAIARHPWFGVGPRQFYGAYINGVGGTPRFYVQNLYLDLATDYGIPTALAFLLLPGVCLWFGLGRIRRMKDPFDRGILAGAIGTMVALLLSCSVDVFGQDPSTTVALGASCGFLLAAGLASSATATHKGALDVRQT